MVFPPFFFRRGAWNSFSIPGQVSHLLEHLHVISCSLFKSLCFHQFVFELLDGEPIFQFFFDGSQCFFVVFESAITKCLAGKMVILSITRLWVLSRGSYWWILILFHPQIVSNLRANLTKSRVYFNNISSNPKCSPAEVYVVSFILHLNQIGEGRLSVPWYPPHQGQVSVWL